MKHRILFWRMVLLWSLSLLAPIAYAQGTMADYERASSLRDKFQGLAVNISERANWIDNTSRFWYRKSVKGGNEFVLVDADTLAKRPAFDHEKLAASLSAAAEGRYTAVTLPPLQGNRRETGSKYRYDVNDGKEIIWMSERDGWRHLYLYDGATGKVKNQITKVPRHRGHLRRAARFIR